ncbi:MAG: protein translocase subunit SecD [Candidatus Aminicenantia bacterium]
MGKDTWKWVITIIVVAVSIYFAYPPKEKIKLGLDLRGGIHLLLHVVTDDAIKMETDHVVLRLQDLFKEKVIKFSNITRGEEDGTISVEGIDLSQESVIRDTLDQFANEWDYTIRGDRIRLTLKPNVALYLRELSVNQAIETIRGRIDELGVAEPIIHKHGTDRILVQLPGVENPERVKNLIKNTALLELKLVVKGPSQNKEDLLKEYNGVEPMDMEVVKSDPVKSRTQGYYLVKKVSVITGKDIRNARVGRDEFNQPIVNFTLSNQGGKVFEKVTSENIGKPLAIILDGRVISAPIIEAVIRDAGRITGQFTQQEAEDLAIVLRSGALPAGIRYLEERTIGPSLGMDSIRKGLRASLISLLIVMIFMVFYYRLSGVNAVIALILNMIILLGVMAYFKATLTLPGIAGVVLTIGMAVDANVLIFERIRENLRLGKSVRASVPEGFKKAWVTILDSNLTTIVAAIFLLQFGTGPVKGFAVTLIIGIIASLFTAVFVSRMIFDFVLSRKKKLEKLSI